MDNQKESLFGYTPEQYKKFKKYAWRYLIMFSLLYCTIYCMRLNITNAGPRIQEELLWDDAKFGIVTSALFWSYGFGHLFNGRLSEIIGPNKFVIASVILSFIANICMGFSESLVVMAIIWGFNGYFQSMAWTPGLATITKWWPGKNRGFAAGFAHGFSAFGQTLVTLVVVFTFWLVDKLAPWTAKTFGIEIGWRAAFFIPPLIPIIMLVLYVIFAKPTPKHIGLQEYVEDNPQKVKEEEEMRALLKTKGKLYPYIHVLSNKTFVFWVVVAFLIGLARYGLVTWIPNIFKTEWNFNTIQSLLMSLPLTLGMAAGTLTVPMLTDKFCPTNRLPAVVLSALASGCAVPVFLLLDASNTLHIVFIEILLFISGFGIYAINGLAFALATDIGGRVFSGTTSGIMDFSLYMGAATQAIVYGFVKRSYGADWVFITISGFCFIIALLAFLGSKKNKNKA